MLNASLHPMNNSSTPSVVHSIGHHRLKPRGETQTIEYAHEVQDVFGLRDSFAAAFPSICKERLDDVIHGVRAASREGLWPRRDGNIKVDAMPTIHVALTRFTVHPMRLGGRIRRPGKHGTIVRHPFSQRLSDTMAVSNVDLFHGLAVDTVPIL